MLSCRQKRQPNVWAMCWGYQNQVGPKFNYLGSVVPDNGKQKSEDSLEKRKMTTRK